MNRRSDHYRRKGLWLPLRELCKSEESHLLVERLDQYMSDVLLRPALRSQRRAKRKTEQVLAALQQNGSSRETEATESH